MPRISILAASALAAFPCLANAEERLGFLDLFSPDRIVQSVVHGGVAALRTQMEVTYGDLAVDVARGRIVMTDVSVTPEPPWDMMRNCDITAERVTVNTTPFDQPDRFIAKLQISGAFLDSACLPPGPREALRTAGFSSLSVPRMTVDLSYGFPASDAQVALYATVENLSNVTLTTRLDYVALNMRATAPNPEPLIYIRHADLSVENLGLWEVVRDALPPQVADPASAALLVQGGLGGLIAEMNRDAAPVGDSPDAGDDPSALSDAQRAFVASAVQAWPAFLETPDRLVLETGITESVYFDYLAAGSDPRYIFEILLPRIAVSPARSSNILPADLLRAAITEPEAVDKADRRTAGLALASGNGAPRNLDAARSLLSALAEAGDGAAAAALSDILSRSDPDDAYRWALTAGETGEPGASARLDRIEGEIGMARALELQGGLPAVAEIGLEPGTTLEEIRNRAARHMTGAGAPRSYRLAVFWASLGAAAGDPESLAILKDLDGRARYASDAGQQAWREAEASASALALDLWLAGDMPARFRP